MQLTFEIAGYWDEDNPVLCSCELEDIFGPLPKRIDVIISKRPLLGSKCFYREGWGVRHRGKVYDLLGRAIKYLDTWDINGRFYVRIGPCD